MLGAMRGQRKKILVILIVGAIILVMALFGLENQWKDGANSSGGAATVNGVSLPMNEFQGMLRSYMRSIEERFGNGNSLKPEMLKMFQVRERTLEGMIQRELQLQAAKRAGLRVSTDELKDKITSMEFFHDPETKKFSYERYVQILQRSLAISPTVPHRFEARISGDLLVDRLQTLMSTAAKVSPVEAKWQHELENTHYRLRYAVLKPSLVKADVNASSEKVKAFVEDKNNSTKIREYYFTHLKNYRQEKEVRASHILLRVLPNATEETKTKAKAKAAEALKALKGGMPWKAAVAKYSEDETTKAKQGDLGFFSKGKMVPAFEAAAFSLKKDGLSDVVMTDFGFHIIRVTDLKAGLERDLDKDPAVKPEIARHLLQSQADEAALNPIKEKLLSSLKNIKTFDRDVKTLLPKAELHTTKAFHLMAETVPDINAELPELMDALPVLKSGQPCPQLYPLKDQEWLVCAVEKVEAAKPLDKLATPEAVERFSKQAQSRLLDSWAETAEKKASISKNASVLRYDI